MEARDLAANNLGEQVLVAWGDRSRGADIIRGRLEHVSHDPDGTTLELTVGHGTDVPTRVSIRNAQNLEVERQS